jgi:biotin transport system substrate-specific component
MTATIRLDRHGVAQMGHAAQAAGIAAMTVATALGAQVAVRLPFTPVPFTLQVFAVLLTGLVLSPRQAFVSQAIYVGAGFLGVPWFAGWTAIPALAGWITAGYLAGFVVAAPVVAIVRTRLGPLAAAMLGIVVIQVAGASVLAALLGLSPRRAFVLGALPFLPFDAVKAMAAVATARTFASPRA